MLKAQLVLLETVLGPAKDQEQLWQLTQPVTGKSTAFRLVLHGNGRYHRPETRLLSEYEPWSKLVSNALDVLQSPLRFEETLKT